MAVFKAYITNESAERRVSMGSFCAHSKLFGNLAVPICERRGPRTRSELGRSQSSQEHMAKLQWKKKEAFIFRKYDRIQLRMD